MMVKSRVAVHPIMGEGESVEIICTPDIFKPEHLIAGSKSTSALPNNNTSAKSFKQRVRSALSLRIKSKYNAHQKADTAAERKEIKSESDSKKKVFAPYLMDLPLEQIRQICPRKPEKKRSIYLMDLTLGQIQQYRPKEGTYGKNKSVRGFKKGVREFGELLVDMCLEDVLAYRGDYKYQAVPFIVVTPCAEDNKPAVLVNSLADLGF